MDSSYKDIFHRERICYAPFMSMHISPTGGVKPCCFSHMNPQAGKRHYGNILKQSIEEIWNSENYQWFRQQIYDKNYTVSCSKNCPFLPVVTGQKKTFVSRILKSMDEVDALEQEISNRSVVLKSPPRLIAVQTYIHCNLKCIMCVTQDMLESYRDVDIDLVNKTTFQQLQQRIGQFRQLSMTGAGEFFVNRHAINFLKEIESSDLSKLTLKVWSNGLLLDQTKIDMLDKMNAARLFLSISVDAASAETYEAIRCGGKWTRLMDNLERISHFRQDHDNVNLALNFVVMRKNVREMVDFARMAKGLNADIVSFQRMYIRERFKNQDVFSDPESLRILKENLMNDALKQRGVDVNAFSDLSAESA